MTKKLCEDFLKNKRKQISFLALYEHLMFKSDYLAFEEKDLCLYLKADSIFEFSSYEKEFWDVDIKLRKK